MKLEDLKGQALEGGLAGDSAANRRGDAPVHLGVAAHQAVAGPRRCEAADHEQGRHPQGNRRPQPDDPKLLRPFQGTVWRRRTGDGRR